MTSTCACAPFGMVRPLHLPNGMKATLAVTRIAIAWVSVLGACDDDDDVEAIGGVSEQCFVRTDLVSNIEGAAVRTDPGLVNAWGLTPALNVFTIVSAGTDTLRAYNADGSIPFSELPRWQPIDEGSTSSAIDEDDRTLYLASEEGVISAIDLERDPTRVQEVIDRSWTGARYFGVATIDDLILAADLHNARIDVIRASFEAVTSPTFINPAVPAGFAPFNVAVLDDVVFVTYAQQDAAREDEVKGPGLGFVSAFARDGLLLWTTGGEPFNAPWGMAIAPDDFGDLGGTLLVGNFGDGRIDVLDRATGEVLGQLRDASSAPIMIDGLWGIATGMGVGGSLLDAIYFTAGPADETQGLYGVIEPCLMQDDVTPEVAPGLVVKGTHDISTSDDPHQDPGTR